jgi:methyl-accepting chemotaxis protein
LLNSVKGKLIVVVVFILAVAIGISNFINQRNSDSAISEKISANMQLNAEITAEGIAKEVGEVKAVVEMVAADTRISTMDLAVGIPRMLEIRRNQPKVEMFFYADLNGKFFADTGASGNIVERDYFKEVMAKKATVVSGEPVISKATNRLVVPIITPLTDANKQIKGFVAATVAIDTIQDYVLGRTIGKEGYAFAIAKTGLLFIHPDNKVVLKLNLLADNSVSPELTDMARLALGGQKGTKEYYYNGKTRIAGYAPVPGTSWAVSTTMPAAEAMAKATEARRFALFVAVITLLLSGGATYFIAVKISRPIIEIKDVAEKIAQGDLRVNELRNVPKDEIGKLANSFTHMVENLRTLVHQISSSSEQVAASSEQLNANAEQSTHVANKVSTSTIDTAKGAERQTKAVTDAVALVQQIATRVRQGAADAQNTVGITDKAVGAALAGNKAVDMAIQQMNSIRQTVDDSACVVTELGERSKEIGQIVGTIAGIAGQTNLLALNAAIEAAQAGEQGRGFAVVADEVRKLAEQSQQAAEQISTLITDILGKTDRAVAVMTNGTHEVQKGTEVVDQAGKVFREIDEHVKEVAGIAQETSKGLNELANISQRVLDAVGEVEKFSREISGQTQTISAASEEQNAAMREISSSSQSLAKLATQLQNAINKFKI